MPSEEPPGPGIRFRDFTLTAIRPRPAALVAALAIAAAVTWGVEQIAVGRGLLNMQIMVSDLSNRIEDAREITLARGAVATMGAVSDVIRKTVLGEAPPDDPAVVAIMRDIVFDIGATTVSIVNSKGIVVGIFDRGGATAFGLDVTSRPYFQGAIKGQSVIYPASGRATSGRGVYVTAPIRGADPSAAPIGISSVKVDYARLQQLLDHESTAVALVSPEKFIFGTNTPAWLYAAVGSAAEIPRIGASERIPERAGLPPPAALTLDSDDRLTLPDGARAAFAAVEFDWNDPAGKWSLIAVERPAAWFGTVGWASTGAATFLAALLLLTALQFRGRRQHQRVMAQQQLESERRQHQHDAFIRNILDASAMAFHCGPVGGPVRVSNQAFRRVFGWRDEHFLRLGEPDLFGAPEAHERMLKELAASGVAVNFEHEARRPDGSKFWALKTSTLAVRDGEELICSWTMDIADRKQIEAQLVAARSIAENATRAKSDFLANMSHEIRTPMNGVMSMAEMLDLTDLSGDQRQMSKIIRDSARALLTIVNDILDFSKIEAGKLAVENISFGLGELVDGVGELLAARAQERDLDLVIQVEPTLVELRQGDPTRVRQILLNLGGNAIKFTERGGVTIQVGPGATEHQVRFEVRDTGIGLTAGQQRGLFEPFVQADASTARKFGGTGLGLSICKRLCELMGGAIGVSSEPGRGSIFWFELPLPALEPAPPGSAHAISAARILLIGLPQSQADIADLYLRAGGVGRIDIAPTLAAARPFAAAGDYDLTVVDARCPDHPGLRVPATLNGPNAYALLAPRTLVSTLNAADRASFKMTLTYPLTRSSLWRAAAAALGLVDPAATEGEFREDLAYVAPDSETARAANAVVLVAEDNRTNQIVIRQMLDRMGFVCDIVEDGVAALDLYRGERARYGILLTDFHMPEMNGFELTGHIRTHETIDGGARLPIIALTADALTGVAQQCIDAGMDEYLTKPIDSRKLGDLLERYMPQALPLRRRRNAQPRRQAGPVPQPAATAEILDTRRLAEALGAFDAAAIDMVRDFIGEAETWREKIAGLLDGGDPAGCRKVAHAAKGAARSVGAARLGDVFSAVQDSCDDGDAEAARRAAAGLAGALAELDRALVLSAQSIAVAEPAT